MNEIDKKALNNQKIPFKYINELKSITQNCNNA